MQVLDYLYCLATGQGSPALETEYKLLERRSSSWSSPSWRFLESIRVLIVDAGARQLGDLRTERALPDCSVVNCSEICFQTAQEHVLWEGQSSFSPWTSLTPTIPLGSWCSFQKLRGPTHHLFWQRHRTFACGWQFVLPDTCIARAAAGGWWGDSPHSYPLVLSVYFRRDFQSCLNFEFYPLYIFVFQMCESFCNLISSLTPLFSCFPMTSG